MITERTAGVPDLPAGADIPVGVDSLFRLNRALTQLPCVTGVSHGLFGDYDASIKAMAETVNEAAATVHVEFFITAWDDTTDIFCAALADAVKRGVKVRLLYDDIASRGYPGFKELNSKLTAAGIEWHEMMPIKPFKGKWRRPDLRNHRKLVVVDGTVAFMGSQNMIDSSYLKPKNIKIGRHWKDLNIKITGEIVTELEAVFAMDWYTETGEKLGGEVQLITDTEGDPVPMQLLPSGPGYLTMPNLRLFSALVQRAQHTLSLTSPYFVPDDSLLEAITTAAYRGVADRTVRIRTSRPIHGRTRPTYLLRRPLRQAYGSTNTQTNHPARQTLHHRRHRRHHRIQQHGLPLIRPRLRNHPHVNRQTIRRRPPNNLRRIPNRLPRNQPRRLARPPQRPTLHRQRDAARLRTAVAPSKPASNLIAASRGLSYDVAANGPVAAGREGRSLQPGHLRYQDRSSQYSSWAHTPRARLLARRRRFRTRFSCVFMGLFRLRLLGRLGFAGDQRQCPREGGGWFRSAVPWRAGLAVRRAARRVGR